MKAKELVAKYGKDSDAICRELFRELNEWLNQRDDNAAYGNLSSKIKEFRLKWQAVARINNSDSMYFDIFIKKNGCEELLEIEKELTPISKRY